MHKATIRLPEGQWQALRATAKRVGLSTAALIRGHLAKYDPESSRVIDGVTLPPSLLIQLKEYHRAGLKIVAIRQAREYYTPRLGLRETKAIVDQLWLDFDRRGGR